jgi:hypothetical protein
VVDVTVRIIVTCVLICAALAALSFLGLHVVPQHVYDGFDSNHLNHFRWSTRRLVAGSIQPEASIVRAGTHALAITVRDNDRYEAASEGGAATERDELMESWWLYARSGRSYVYSFSLNLPTGFPQTSERLVLAQWRQLCEAKHCEPDRPILAIRYEDGRIQITKQEGEKKVLLYQGTEDVRGKWVDFRFVVRFSSDKSGRIEASLNQRSVANYQGSTLFTPGPGYPSNALIYFKTGLYRDALHQPPWTIYVDEYRKDECSTSDCR